MAKSARGRRRTVSTHHHRTTPYPPLRRHVSGEVTGKPKDWEDITCSVCMEYPHKAVLLLCSSHDNGCRPYMCGTGPRHSNCLHQYKTAAQSPPPVEKGGDGAELACPLCRGQVKGWTVVQSARKYLNSKKRSCMHDACSFVGVYKELKKHVRAAHPSGKPREVDPTRERNWRRLERDREREDMMSALIPSVFGSVDSNGGDTIRAVMNVFDMLHSIGGPGAFINALAASGVGGGVDDVISLVERVMRLNVEINRVILGGYFGPGRRRRSRR